MGFVLNKSEFNRVLEKLRACYAVYAPKLFERGANFSDADLVRYGAVTRIDEVVFDKKSAASYKEALHRPSQTLFYFTENDVTEAKCPAKKPLVFLRSCDIHGLARFDDVMIQNGEPDYFYERVRRNVRLALMPCKTAFESCFCVDMNANKCDEYDFSVEKDGEDYRVNCKAADMRELFASCGAKEADVAVPS